MSHALGRRAVVVGEAEKVFAFRREAGEHLPWQERSVVMGLRVPYGELALDQASRSAVLIDAAGMDEVGVETRTDPRLAATLRSSGCGSAGSVILTGSVVHRWKR